MKWKIYVAAEKLLKVHDVNLTGGLSALSVNKVGLQHKQQMPTGSVASTATGQDSEVSVKV